MLSIDLSQQLRSEMPAIVVPPFNFAFARSRQAGLENLRAQFHHAIFNCRQNANWRITVAMQQTQELAFGSQTKQSLAIVYRIDNRSHTFITCANLESDDPLSACGKKTFARENLSKKLAVFERDFGLRRREAKPLKPGAREDNCGPIVLGEPAQPSWHIAAKIDNLDIRTFPGKLMFPSHTTAPDCRAFPERSQTARLFCNQYVIHRCTRKNRCDLRAWVRFARQIFRTVHCNINISGEKGSLDFSGKQSFSPLAQVSSFRVGFIAAGPNDFCFDRNIRPFFTQCLFHHPCLGSSQFAAARSDY